MLDTRLRAQLKVTKSINDIYIDIVEKIAKTYILNFIEFIHNFRQFNIKVTHGSC